MRLDNGILETALKAMEFQRDQLVGELDSKIAAVREALGIRGRGKRKGALDTLAAAAAAEGNGNSPQPAARSNAPRPRKTAAGNPEISRADLMPAIFGYLAHQRDTKTTKEIADAIRGNVPNADQHGRFSIVVMHALNEGQNGKLFKKTRGKWERVKGAKLPEPQQPAANSAGGNPAEA